MTTEVYEVSTVLGLCTIAAIAKRRPKTGRRVLLVSINSRYPEVESWYLDNPSVQELASEFFDDVVELNEEIFPIHPSRWRWDKSWSGHRKQWLERLGMQRLDVLYVESLQAPPSWSLTQLFGEAEVRAYSDGMMVYSPTRNSLPKSVLRRTTEVCYVDYVKGTTPLLLDEVSPTYTPIDMGELRPFFERIRSPSDVAIAEAPHVLFLGQAMANSRMMEADQEDDLYIRALSDLGEAFGPEHVVFKAHPSAPMSSIRAVEAGFRSATGSFLRVLGGRVPIESVVDAEQTLAVCGVFSTALFTLRELFGIPAFTCGAKDVLFGLQPYENSNRIPLVAADVLLPTVRELSEAITAAGPSADVARVTSDIGRVSDARLQTFREAQLLVGVAMQPRVLKHRVSEAQELRAIAAIPCLDLYLLGKDRRDPNPVRGLPAVTGKMLEETARFIVRMTLDERKQRKFDRDPARFFEESKVSGARLFSRALGRLRTRDVEG